MAKKAKKSAKKAVKKGTKAAAKKNARSVSLRERSVRTSAAGRMAIKARELMHMSRDQCVDHCLRVWSGSDDVDDSYIVGNLIDASKRDRFKKCITACTGVAPGWHIDYGWTVGTLKEIVRGL